MRAPRRGRRGRLAAGGAAAAGRGGSAAGAARGGRRGDAGLEDLDDVGGRDERVGDHARVAQRRGGYRAPVDERDDGGGVKRRRGVQRGELLEDGGVAIRRGPQGDGARVRHESIVTLRGASPHRADGARSEGRPLTPSILLAMRFWSHDRHGFPLPSGHRFPLPKYRLLREAVEREGLGEVCGSDAAPWALLAAVHDPDYLDRVRRGELSRREERALGLPGSPELLRA